MDALAAYGSDTSSSSEDEAQKSKPQLGSSGGGAKNGNNQLNAPSSSLSAFNPPPKRQRRWDQPAVNKHSCLLPPPPLATTNDKAGSMIQWNEDYVKQKSTARHNESAVDSSELAKRLKGKTDALLAKKQGATPTNNDIQTTWPRLLQLTHEFHNPRFLENVAHQCGISTTMNSSNNNNNNNNRNDSGETFQEFEFRLLELEEKARVQTYEQQHNDASSDFAQNQLSRALQRQCQR